MSQSNPKDPLLQTGPEHQRALFDKFSTAADGYSAEDAIGAAANIIVNALRQVHNRRDVAETRFDEIFGRTKQILMNHYDSLGRKRGIFPFDQTIHAPHFVDREKF